MLFYAFEFQYFFLPIALLGYFFCAAKIGQRHAIIFLILASLLFYGSWNAKYLLFLIPSIIANYYLGLWLQTHKSKALLWFSVILNLAFLAYFKYTNFFLDTLDTFAGTHWQIEHIILPIGISFYTFQQIAWIVDSFSGKVDTRTESFWKYALFVSFFPQLIAGPIVHHSEMMPQFSTPTASRFRWSSFAAGLSIFVIGLVKKVVLADGMASIATPVFTDAANGTIDFTNAWAAAVAFTLQVYFDFSGYSDMAIGLARMFNIRLPVNFNSPLKAASFIQLWERWHMTMTRFFQHYVHVPLSVILYRKQRQFGIKNNASIHLSTFITFLAVGFWHGANWTFLVFGFLHGCFLITNHIWRGYRKKKGIAEMSVAAGTALTFFFFVITCVVYRSENLMVAANMYHSMFAPDAFMGATLSMLQIVLGIAALFIALFMPNTQQIMRRYRPVFDMSTVEKIPASKLLSKLVWRPTVAWFLFLVFASGISLYTLLDDNKVQEFIYFQF